MVSTAAATMKTKVAAQEPTTAPVKPAPESPPSSPPQRPMSPVRRSSIKDEEDDDDEELFQDTLAPEDFNMVRYTHD